MACAATPTRFLSPVYLKGRHEINNAKRWGGCEVLMRTNEWGSPEKLLVCLACSDLQFVADGNRIKWSLLGASGILKYKESSSSYSLSCSSTHFAICRCNVFVVVSLLYISSVGERTDFYWLTGDENQGDSSDLLPFVRIQTSMSTINVMSCNECTLVCFSG